MTGEEDRLVPSLQAGIAIYNTGRYHAAHDAWEEYWLSLEEGTDDELFLHGLIQFTAAIYHARNRNWSGAVGLATSARSYLAPLPPDYRGVNLGEVTSTLHHLGTDPAAIERRRPLVLTFEGEALMPDDLDFAATSVAAEVIAEEDGYDESVFETAIEYAQEDIADDETSPIVTLVFDFVRQPADRGIISQRLREHVDRRQHRDTDVDGLFETRD